MDYASIKELIKMIDDSKLTSFELEFDGVSLKMGKGDFKGSSSTKGDTLIQEKTYKQQEIKSVLESVSSTEEINVKDDVACNYVVSPIVGTFYSSPSANKEPYVKIGDKVKKGDILCIIEAMKIMNEIKSEYDGTIVDILVSNEQMVEYGQKLFSIR